MLSNSKYKIHKYNDMYCLNDVVIQCEISKCTKDYYTSISEKVIYNSQFYVTKEKLFDLLKKAKVYKSNTLLKYLQDENTSNDILEIVDLTKKNNEITNFVDYGTNNIFFNQKKIKYFYYNKISYFKAKDVAELLDYTDTKQSIRKNVAIDDKFLLYNIIEDCIQIKHDKEGGYNLASPLNSQYTEQDIEGGCLVDAPLNTHTSITSGTLENNKNKLDPKKLSELKPIYNIIKNEDLQTIFINQSGLYSLVLNSKKHEAKVFKKWITSDVIPSIMSTGKYVSSKLLEYNNDEIKKFNGKDCVYVLHIKDNIYKFGKSSKIQERLSKHRHMLDYINIEKIYELKNMNDTGIMENKIKDFIKINKINTTYNNQIECFECNNNITIDMVMENIDSFYNMVSTDDNTIQNNDMNKIFNKIEEMNAIMHVISDELNTEKNQNKKILLELEKIKLELEILKETKSNITETKENKTCIDCNKVLTTKFASRCGPCERKDRLKVAIESKERPSYEQLKKDLEDLRFVSHVAKKYNVSNSCITRWIANYEKYNEMIKEPVKENNKPEKIKKDKYIKTTPIKKELTPTTLENTKKDPKIENPEKYKHCPDCNTMIVLKSTRCLKCMNKNKIKETILNSGRPSLEQLKKDIVELKSMVKVGHKYNVSDNAIRKWIKNHEAFADKVKI